MYGFYYHFNKLRFRNSQRNATISAAWSEPIRADLPFLTALPVDRAGGQRCGARRGGGAEAHGGDAATAGGARVPEDRGGHRCEARGREMGSDDCIPQESFGIKGC